MGNINMKTEELVKIGVPHEYMPLAITGIKTFTQSLHKLSLESHLRRLINDPSRYLEDPDFKDLAIGLEQHVESKI